MDFKKIKGAMRKPALIFCENLARVYLVVTALNDGVTGIVFGIPYLAYLVVLSIHDFKSGSRFNPSVNILFFVFFFFFGFTDRSENKHIYPIIGQTLEFQSDVEFVNGHIPFELSHFKCDIAFEDSVQHLCKTFRFKKGDKFKVLKKKLVSNADFGTYYLYTILPENSELAVLFNSHGFEVFKEYKRKSGIGDEKFRYLKNSFKHFIKGVGNVTSLEDLGKSKKMFFDSHWLRENADKLNYKKNSWAPTNGLISWVFLHLFTAVPIFFLFLILIRVYSPIQYIKKFI